MKLTNKLAIEKWVKSLSNKVLADLLYFALTEKSKRKKAATKLMKKQEIAAVNARRKYEDNYLKDKTDNILIDDNTVKNLNFYYKND